MSFPSRHFRAMTFDVVGTLIDFEAGLVSYFNRSLCGEVSATAILEAFARAEHLEHQRNPSRSFSVMLKGIYDRIAGSLALDQSAAARAEFLESIHAWPPFPDSIEALRMLEKHYRLVAITNAGNNVAHSLVATLEYPFVTVITAEDAGESKPRFAPFHHAIDDLRKAGIRRDEILHVAQSQFHDIAPAKALGLATCWIDRRRDQPGYGATPTPEQEVSPDYHFPSLKALAAAVTDGL